MNRGEFLKRLCASEPEHGSFSSPEGLVGVFNPVVQPASGLLPATHLYCVFYEDPIRNGRGQH